MKTRLFVSVLVLAVAGCSSLPKDAYIRNAQLNTPWGSTKIEAAATGAAARNLTESERKELLAPKAKK